MVGVTTYATTQALEQDLVRAETETCCLLMVESVFVILPWILSNTAPSAFVSRQSTNSLWSDSLQLEILASTIMVGARIIVILQGQAQETAFVEIRTPILMVSPNAAVTSVTKRSEKFVGVRSCIFFFFCEPEVVTPKQPLIYATLPTAVVKTCVHSPDRIRGLVRVGMLMPWVPELFAIVNLATKKLEPVVLVRTPFFPSLLILFLLTSLRFSSLIFWEPHFIFSSPNFFFP